MSSVPREAMVPILGTIRAGRPTLAVEEVAGYAPAEVVRPEALPPAGRF